MSDDGIVLRPVADGDRNFILSSWLKSYGEHSRWARLADRAYYPGHHALVSRLLDRADVLCAVWESDPDVVIGWACTEPGVVHYAYVKQAFRRRGIFKRMVGAFWEADATYTHEAPRFRVVEDGKRVRREVNGTERDVYVTLALPERWSFDPYRAFMETTR